MLRLLLALVALGFCCRTAPKVARLEAPIAPAAARLAIAAPARIEPLPFERTVADRMRAAAQLTVEVDQVADGIVVGHGSGVFVSPNGELLTAAHVVRDRRHRFRVLFPDGTRRDATVLRVDEARDVALLRAPGPPTPFVKVRAGAAPPGRWIVCAGFGGEVAGDHVAMRTAGAVVEPAFAWTVTEYKPGRHAPIPDKTSTFSRMLRTDCKTAPGMSGGPALDLDGALVGIVVGSGGVVSPLAAARSILPPTARFEAANAAPDLAPVEALAARFEADAAARSIFEMEAPRPLEQAATFAAVLLSTDGLVLAPSLPVGSSANHLVVKDHPGARCVDVVATRGELALLRCIGLTLGDHPLLPIAEGHEARLGELVSIVARADQKRVIGFVTAEDRHPGTVAEDRPRYGCGMVRGHFASTHPAVEVGAALAHDAAWITPGAILVDRAGHPVAIDVAPRAPGLTFAIPWTDVKRRFAQWLPQRSAFSRRGT